MKRHLVPTMDAFLFTPLVSYLGIGRMCSRCRRDLVSRWPRPARHRLASVSSLDGSGGQISPDKNVNCRDTTAAFTVSPEPWAWLCCANLPGDSALYAISVRRLIVLHSSFLRTRPRGNALAFGKYLCSCLHDNRASKSHFQRQDSAVK